MKTNLLRTALIPAVFLALLLLAYACFPGQTSPSPGASLTEASTPKKQTIPSPETQGTGPSDPMLLAALAEADPTRRGELLDEWAQTIDSSEMGDRLEQIESIANNENKTEVRTALLSHWAKSDLTSAVTWFGKRGGADELHQQARDLFAKALAGREPVAMVAWMQQSLPESSRKELYGPFFRQWTEGDPAGAAALLRQMAIPPTTNPTTSDPLWTDLMGQVVSQWAAGNVNSAVGFVKTLPEGSVKAQALMQVSYEWAARDPQSAATYAAGENNNQLIKNVSAKWAETDPQAAAAWVRNLPQGEAATSAATGVTAIWAQKDPTAAAAFATSCPSGQMQVKAALSVVSSWAYTDPAQAAQWVGQFPEGSLREQVQQALISTWAQGDVSTAAQWLQSLPHSHSRDVAVAAFSNTTDSTTPETAFQWAQTISDQGLRNQQLQSVAKVWFQSDSSEAQQQIAQSNLPSSLKSQLLSAGSP